MTTVFKLQLSLLGNKVRDAVLGTSPIEIGESPRNAATDLRRPFKSLPSETNKGAGILSINIKSDDEDLPHYSLLEILSHDTDKDCWVIVYDRVYDLTNFLYEHPGGYEIILEYAGRDATLAFRSVGHTKTAVNALKSYLIGILAEDDRLWMHYEDRRGSR